jgi:hypothetical protein
MVEDACMCLEGYIQYLDREPSATMYITKKLEIESRDRGLLVTKRRDEASQIIQCEDSIKLRCKPDKPWENKRTSTGETISYYCTSFDLIQFLLPLYYL